MEGQVPLAYSCEPVSCDPVLFYFKLLLFMCLWGYPKIIFCGLLESEMFMDAFDCAGKKTAVPGRRPSDVAASPAFLT